MANQIINYIDNMETDLQKASQQARMNLGQHSNNAKKPNH